MDKDIAGTFKKYPPHRICDEWRFCADDCNIQARDMHCEDCDFYWELVELADKGDIDLRDVEKEEIKRKRIREIFGQTNGFIGVR